MEESLFVLGVSIWRTFMAIPRPFFQAGYRSSYGRIAIAAILRARSARRSLGCSLATYLLNHETRTGAGTTKVAGLPM